MLDKAFVSAMSLVETQSDHILFLDEENDRLRMIIKEAADLFERRGYNLEARAFKNIKKETELINGRRK